MLLRKTVLVATLCLLSASAARLSGQSGAKGNEWRTYGGDLANTHYSPADQINASNFNKLTVAWTFKTDSLRPVPGARSSHSMPRPAN
jgi:quinoprotein glucose dehydrogenase